MHVGSTPSQSTKGSIVELVKTPACHVGDRGFKSRWNRKLVVLLYWRAAHFAKVFDSRKWV